MKNYIVIAALTSAALIAPGVAQAADDNPVQHCGKDWKRFAFHALNLTDKLVSHEATTSGRFKEVNPIITPVVGKRIDLLEAAALFALSSGLYEYNYSRLTRNGSCRSAKQFQNIALALQGSVTGWTVGVRFVF